MQIPGFPGPAATEWSILQNDEETINWFPAFADSGAPRARLSLLPTPGLEVYTRLATAPVRGLFAQDGRAFAVAGDQFYELFASQNNTARGTVASDANPATINSNGTAGDQLFITSGGSGYIYDLTSNTLSSAITEPGFPVPALMGQYLDSYFLALKGQSIQFNWSDLLDGETWPALNVAQVSQSSDNLVTLAVNHREIWLYGTKTTAVWLNTGDTSVFQPLSQAYLQVGCAASFSVARFDNSLLWLGLNEHGARVVYRADGYNPQRVSTHAIEAYLNALDRVSDAIAWTYQDMGHVFYVLYLPTADHTLVYDASTQLWHKRALWDQTRLVWRPHVGRCHCYAFDTHLVGDRQSGAIYSMKLPFRDATTGNWRYADDEILDLGGL
jgi:hypothetical protein